MNPLLAWNNRRGRLLYRETISASLYTHISLPWDGWFSVAAIPQPDGSAMVYDKSVASGHALAERGCLFQWVSTGPRQGRISVYLDLLHQDVIAAPSEAEQ